MHCRNLSPSYKIIDPKAEDDITVIDKTSVGAAGMKFWNSVDITDSQCLPV